MSDRTPPRGARRASPPLLLDIRLMRPPMRMGEPACRTVAVLAPAVRYLPP